MEMVEESDGVGLVIAVTISKQIQEHREHRDTGTGAADE